MDDILNCILITIAQVITTKVPEEMVADVRMKSQSTGVMLSGRISISITLVDENGPTRPSSVKPSVN